MTSTKSLPSRRHLTVGLALLAIACTSNPSSGEDVEGEGGTAGAAGARGAAGAAGGGEDSAGGGGGADDKPPVVAGQGGQPDLSWDAGVAGMVNKPDAMPTAKTDTAPPAAGADYKCSMFLGPNVTGEWFAAGFETLADNARWQVKAPHRSFVEDWANPNHDVWRESGCQGTFYNCETKSKCAGGAAVDRVIFVTQTGNYLGTPQGTWETMITKAIATIKGKYPGVKNVELMTFVRGPGNKNCGNETTVSSNLDNAHKALAAASGGKITVSPRFEVGKCEHFGGAPHLTAEGNKYVANLIGKHYAAEK